MSARDEPCASSGGRAAGRAGEEGSNLAVKQGNEPHHKRSDLALSFGMGDIG